MNTSGKALEVFNLLAECRISLDTIQVSPQRITFTVKEALFDRTTAILEETGLD